MRAHRAHYDGVAIVGRLGHDVAADVAASAGLVVNDHGLAQLGFFTEQARQDVGCTACWEGDHQANGAGRISLSRRRGAAQKT